MFCSVHSYRNIERAGLYYYAQGTDLQDSKQLTKRPIAGRLWSLGNEPRQLEFRLSISLLTLNFIFTQHSN